MKYIFKQIDDISGLNATTTVEFSADSLSDILEQFQFFLKGSGYHFEGNVDITQEDTYRDDESYDGDGHEGMGSTVEDYPEIQEQHSDYYWDTERNKPATQLFTARGEDNYSNFLKEYDKAAENGK